MTRLKEALTLKEFHRRAPTLTIITPKQFFGLDIDPFGVELAKVTLMLAKKLALDEAADALDVTQEQMTFGGSDALPLDNLDDNIHCADALFSDWPETEVIVGNPPYQSKNKIQGEMDRSYINRLRDKYPEIYRSLELPGDHPLKNEHADLDAAVRRAYGMTKTADPLAVLLELNAQVAAAEANGEAGQGPGLPSFITNPAPYITKDCIKP